MRLPAKKCARGTPLGDAFGFRKDVEILAEEAKERYKTAKYIVQVPFGKRITFTITVLRLTAKLHLGEESKNLKAKDKSDMWGRNL
ncbi:hypothetical protein Plhal703r1_c21g0093031 [Plasmopara halstedii]